MLERTKKRVLASCFHREKDGRRAYIVFPKSDIVWLTFINDRLACFHKILEILMHLIQISVIYIELTRCSEANKFYKHLYCSNFYTT